MTETLHTELNVDRKRAVEAFDSYTAAYNAKDEKIKLKIDHTYRVAGLCEKIARSLNLEERAVDLAWLTGLLHDVGRFEQLKNYGTFIDADSIDHALYGADILFKEGRIRDYIADAGEDVRLEKAIRCHSAYRIPEEYDEETTLLSNILRDADKIDILKVNVDIPMEEIYNVTTEELYHAQVSPAVMKSFQEQHATLRSMKKTPVDHLAGHISLVYELVFPVSRELVEQQGYLERMLCFSSENPVTREQFQTIRYQIEQFLHQEKQLHPVPGEGMAY